MLHSYRQNGIFNTPERGIFLFLVGFGFDILFTMIFKRFMNLVSVFPPSAILNYGTLCVGNNITISTLLDKIYIKAHLQEIVRCSFKLKLDLDVIPSLSD
jgi:hypothetical protein